MKQKAFPVSECHVASFEEEASKGDSDRDCSVFSGAKGAKLPYRHISAREEDKETIRT